VLKFKRKFRRQRLNLYIQFVFTVPSIIIKLHCTNIWITYHDNKFQVVQAHRRQLGLSKQMKKRANSNRQCFGNPLTVTGWRCLERSSRGNHAFRPSRVLSIEWCKDDMSFILRRYRSYLTSESSSTLRQEPPLLLTPSFRDDRMWGLPSVSGTDFVHIFRV